MVQGFGWETKLYGPPAPSPQEKRCPSGKCFLQLLAVTNTRPTDTPTHLSLQSKLGGPSGRGICAHWQSLVSQGDRLACCQLVLTNSLWREVMLGRTAGKT